MSKKITHEQARESIEMVDGSFFPTEKEALLTYIKQQERDSKLLELYIDLTNTIEVLDNAYGYEIFEFGEIKYICNKIKELGWLDE